MQQGQMDDITDLEIDFGDDGLKSGENIKHANLRNVEENTAASKDADHLEADREIRIIFF